MDTVFHNRSKIAVIDDAGCVLGAFEKAIPAEFPEASLDTMRSLHGFDFDNYDALVVDNDGIGDDRYPNGVAFCKAFKQKHRTKLVIHFTGYCNGEDRKELERMGVIVVTKGMGCDPVIKELHRLDTFTFQMGICREENCRFMVSSYKSTDNLFAQVVSEDGAPYIIVTVNPPHDEDRVEKGYICVKDYSENTGMVDWLKGMGLIEGEPVKTFESGFVKIPVYKLTELGRKEFIV